MPFLITVDPGAHGGICCWHPLDAYPSATPMPKTPKDTCELLQLAVASRQDSQVELKAYMELVSGFAGVGQPGSAAFTFGRGYGNLEGFLIALGIPFEVVAPTKWQRALGCPVQEIIKGKYDGMTDDQKKEERNRVSRINSANKRQKKNAMKEMAQRFFPQLKVTLETADALLLMQYARRLHEQPQPQS